MTGSIEGPPSPARVGRAPLSQADSVSAGRRWWDADAAAYQAEHGAFLGDADFVWCPEGLREADARLLGEVRGRTVLEVGCGAAQCSRWLIEHGAESYGIDVSHAQLAYGRRLDRSTGTRVPVAQADACRLPFADGAFDLACSAYGAIPFVADSAGLMSEVARVLRPGGRWVFSVTHPIRWCFPDDPGPAGLVARDSYFDTTPYVEQAADGSAVYAEHHRTLGQRVRELVGAGFTLVDLVEPEWPEGENREWGQWSPLRGRVIPGTAIFVAELPA